MPLKSVLKRWLAPGPSAPQETAPKNPLLDRMKERVEKSGKYYWGQTWKGIDVLPDGKPVLDPSRGEDYGSFWGDVAKTREGALMVTRQMIIDEETDAFISEDVADMIHRVLRLSPASRVLDVGSGLGSLAIHIAPKVGAYALADISTTMLDQARKRLEGIPGTSFHHLERCDLREFPDNHFDGVFFEAVMGHMDREDSYRYMRETHRALRPGGRAYFQFFNLLHPRGFAEFEHTMENLCDGRGKNLISRTRFHTPVEARAYVTHAGLVIDEECSQLADIPGESLLHINEHALVAVCTKPGKKTP